MRNYCAYDNPVMESFDKSGKRRFFTQNCLTYLANIFFLPYIRSFLIRFLYDKRGLVQSNVAHKVRSVLSYTTSDEFHRMYRRKM